VDIGSALRKSAHAFGDRTAVICGERTLTYRQLHERACRLASALIDLGLTKGDRVATLGDNALQTIEEIAALALAGLVRAPMYTQNTADVQLHMLNLTGAKALIVQDSHLQSFADRLDEASELEHVIVHGGGRGELDYQRLLNSADPRDPQVPTTDDDLHIIRFSAGTTGLPKGIVHTYGGWRQMATEFAVVLPRMSEMDAQLICGPMSHASGLIVGPVIAAGAAQVLMPKFDPGQALELIERHRCTVMLMVPTMIQMVVNHPEAGRRDMSSLRTVFYGAAPIAEKTLERALALMGRDVMHQIYGQSETLPVTALLPEHHIVGGDERQRKRLRSAGRPTPNSLVKIVDDDGRELPCGQIGEIAARSPGAMKEIWRDPAATAERLMPDGFIRTRDLGYIDEDGFVYVADRKEDMIISGGFNIWPAELENALLSHPAVIEAAVVAVPHEKWGETPRAVVVLREGLSATEQELIDWCRQHVGGTKKPTSVEFSVQPLPKNSAGKVLRRMIRERYWSALESRIAGA
jgi:acyl-CoA synthetase (AMP-forming)/AMP-acid ligase II